MNSYETQSLFFLLSCCVTSKILIGVNREEDGLPTEMAYQQEDEK